MTGRLLEDAGITVEFRESLIKHLPGMLLETKPFGFGFYPAKPIARGNVKYGAVLSKSAIRGCLAHQYPAKQFSVR